MNQYHVKWKVAYFSLILFSVVFISIIFSLTIELDSDNFSYITWITIAYISGMSMIVLPCTMPLVFIIIPLSIGKGYKKGFFMSLLFGLGLTITITCYGAMIAMLGDIISLQNISSIMFFIAGSIAFIFGLTQLNLLNLKLPSYSGIPKFINKQREYKKSFFMGLLLGNAGVGCPNPMFYWLLMYIANTESIEIGSTLGFVHGIGRAIPLIFISIITILGINIQNTLIKKQMSINIITGFVLIVIGSFLIINSFPNGHIWYEETIAHRLWNNIIKLIPSIQGEISMHDHAHMESIIQIPKIAMPAILLILIIFPIIWYKVKNIKSIE